mgnify:CR=1 FL=1
MTNIGQSPPYNERSIVFDPNQLVDIISQGFCLLEVIRFDRIRYGFGAGQYPQVVRIAPRNQSVLVVFIQSHNVVRAVKRTKK